MRCFFDKPAIVVDVTDKEVIVLFQDGLYHCRTFEDFGCRRPSSITKLKDMITSWADEEDKANAKYDAIRGKSKHNSGGNNNNTRDQGGRNNNNYSGTNRSANQTTRSRLSCALRKTTRRRLLAASKIC
jgi:transcriptional accessory protein Tex/SPT6